MQIEIPNNRNVHAQAVAAGFSSVEDSICVLRDRDAERVAVQKGLRAMNEGRVRPFEEFDRDFRKRYDLSPF